MIRQLRWGMLATLCILALAAIPGMAAAAGGVGVIDMSQVQKEYKGYEEASKYLMGFSQKLAKPGQTLQMGLGLPKADLDTYTKLKDKEAADQAAITKMEETSRNNLKVFQELRDRIKGGLADADKESFDQIYRQILTTSSQALQSEDAQKELADAKTRFNDLVARGKTAAKLTDDEQKNYDALQGNIEANYVSLIKFNDGYQKQMDDERQRLEKLFSGELDKAIGKVAADMKLTMVLSKEVMAGQDPQTGQPQMAKLVLWTDKSVDISTKVKDTLNASFKVEMLQKP